MAAVYFDASAFVKLLLDEDGSDTAAALWDGCDLALSSPLSYAEVRAALAAAQRSGRITSAELAVIEPEWDDFWLAVVTVELSDVVAIAAGQLCADFALRGADGIHLASALALGDLDCIVAVWDRRLAEGAIAVGLRTAPVAP
jgi:uncharacterized protein